MLINTKTRKLSFALSILLLLVSILGLSLKGLNWGIDFSGGYITEFTTSQSVAHTEMESQLAQVIDTEFNLTSAQDDTYWIVRNAEASSINENIQWTTDLSKKLNEELSPAKSDEALIVITPMDSDFIDSQIGEELIEQGGLSLMAALLVVLIYLATRYEWRFALGAIWALLHDVIIVIGLFAWLQLEMNLTVLAAFLAIVGYSLNDSIVLLDKIREFMQVDSGSEINELVNKSIYSTLGRTLITSGTTLITISAIWWLAGLSLNEFSIALFAGILVGTFSSIGISATLPVLLGIKSDYFIQKENELMKLREEP